MREDFSRTLCLLGQERGLSQRKVAAELGISQALLSHYEKGVREPGLNFVVRACDYYHVSADFMLGRSPDRDGINIGTEALYDASEERAGSMQGSIMATLQKKLLVNSISVLFALLGKVGSREAVMAAAAYIGDGIYRIFRRLYLISPDANEDMFNITPNHFNVGVVTSDMIFAEADFSDALAAHTKEKGPVPPMDRESLSAAYPGAYQSLYQVIHTTGERIQKMAAFRKN